MAWLLRDKTEIVRPDHALPGRSEPMRVPDRHEVLGTTLTPPFPEGFERAILGMGCFWGAERVFWQAALPLDGLTNPNREERVFWQAALPPDGLTNPKREERVFWQAPGVYTTAVGYAGGYTPNPTYEEVCSGRTGHTEVVLVVFDPARTDYDEILRVFWENHDPTQGMRQGNDVGTQYRSLILSTTPAQRERAERSRAMFQQALASSGFGEITTEITDGDEFFYAEPYHQQYLAKNPNGYCGLGGTGVSCPVSSALPSPAG